MDGTTNSVCVLSYLRFLPLFSNVSIQHEVPQKNKRGPHVLGGLEEKRSIQVICRRKWKNGEGVPTKKGKGRSIQKEKEGC